MAHIYARTPEIIARHKDVALALDEIAFEVAARAEELLVQHRAEGDAEIDIEAGRIDRYVVLSDDRGQKAALSIEYGRDAYTTTRTDRHGNEFEVEVPAMDGLFILARAAGLPKKRKGKVKLD
ncbi:DUF5403 family protein [Streptomyces sp. WZ.A104]|uniref:DUF5403 family protein n=1 Tax=Streptomyces sp. WZ.A104 TaxID=2023771 RepID=UPI0015CA6588|nr:DUF5403 family protein [Streptomyces sp. WZ.A104]